MEARPPISPPGWFVALWGIGGVLALLASAIVRLTPIAIEALGMQLEALEWVALSAWVLFMGYAEGWRGFHKRFAPRVVARAFHLARRPTPLAAALAPLYCMSLFASTRRGKIVAWSLLGGITLLVVFVRLLPQPWRGLVDVGVVIGLGIGSISIAWHTSRALRYGPTRPNDLPLSTAAPQAIARDRGE